jgi:hypothetical protein
VPIFVPSIDPDMLLKLQTNIYNSLNDQFIDEKKKNKV